MLLNLFSWSCRASRLSGCLSHKLRIIKLPFLPLNSREWLMSKMNETSLKFFKNKTNKMQKNRKEKNLAFPTWIYVNSNENSFPNLFSCFLLSPCPSSMHCKYFSYEFSGWSLNELVRFPTKYLWYSIM